MNRVVVDAVGAHVTIELAGLPPVDRAAVAELWRDAAVDTRGVHRPLTATVELGTAFEFSSVLADLSTRVTVAALGARRGDLWMLHACGVANERGRVAVLVGPSGAGKTTAATVLARRFGYVSDESIGILASGEVLPYRKPLSIVRPGEMSKEQVAPSDLKLKPLPDTPLTLAALIFLDRRRGGAGAGRQPELTPAPESIAMATLAEQSSYLTEMPTPLHTMSAHLRRLGGAHRLSYDDASHLPDVIADLFSAPPGEHDSDTDDDPTGMFAEAQMFRGDPDDGVLTYVQSPFVDATIVENGQVALLRAFDDAPAQVIVLAPHAAAVWRMAADAVSLREETLRRVAEELVAHGLLERR